MGNFIFRANLPIGDERIESVPSVQSARFQNVSLSQPFGSLIIRPGEDQSTAVSETWLLSARSSLSYDIMIGASSGGALVISTAVQYDITNNMAWRDHAAIALVGNNAPNILTGYSLPGIVAKIRLVVNDTSVNRLASGFFLMRSEI